MPKKAIVVALGLVLSSTNCAWIVKNSDCSRCVAPEFCLQVSNRHYACGVHPEPFWLMPSPQILKSEP